MTSISPSIPHLGQTVALTCKRDLPASHLAPFLKAKTAAIGPKMKPKRNLKNNPSSTNSDAITAVQTPQNKHQIQNEKQKKEFP